MQWALGVQFSFSFWFLIECLVDYGVARRKGHWYVPPTNGLALKLPKEVRPIVHLEGKEEGSQGEGSLMIHFSSLSFHHD